MKRLHFLMIWIFVCGILICGKRVNAAVQDIPVERYQTVEMELKIGDTGNLIPMENGALLSELTFYYEQASVGSNFYDYDVYDDDYDMNISFADRIMLAENGSYQALKTGDFYVDIYTYDGIGEKLFFAKLHIVIRVDMTNVTLEKTAVTGYLYTYFSYWGDTYSNYIISIPINSNYVLNQEADDLDISIESSNSKIYVYDIMLENNVLSFEVNGKKAGKSTLSIMIEGKVFKVALTLKKVTISDDSYLLVKGKKKTLKISGFSDKIQWISSNPKIATVSKNGTVKGKKIGNVVITAVMPQGRLGCAVSVTTSKIKKVVNRASYIGKNWKYSQPLRMSNGYYDCSALVWKAYKQYGKVNFGSPSYASVALGEAKWCKAHGKMIKGGFSSKNLSKMKVNPGDLLFKSTYPKKPYQDIYHVEMFTGYRCVGYDGNGNPVVSTMWAARGDNYAYPDGQLLGRPLK